MNPMNVIVTDQLTKCYGRRVGIQDLTLSVPEGSVYGFLGPNGAGKTTTLRCLLGFLKPTRGRARIFEWDCWSESPQIKKEVGYLPGDLQLPYWMTGNAAVQFAGLTRHLDLSAAGAELADDLGLEMNVCVRRMSRGMRQKLGLLLALVHAPSLLILDEPTASLDPLTQDFLYTHLRELARRGHTVLFSSHVLSEVENLCDRVAIVREGKLIVDETLEGLRQRARRTVIIRWKTAPRANAAPPPVLEVRERQGILWECDLKGRVEDLLHWLNEYEVEDLSIEQPDLGSLFRQFYQESESSS